MLFRIVKARSDLRASADAALQLLRQNKGMITQRYNDLLCKRGHEKSRPKRTDGVMYSESDIDFSAEMLASAEMLWRNESEFACIWGVSMHRAPHLLLFPEG
jgi:hypothetical protein